jgi:hypothetical protein
MAETAAPKLDVAREAQPYAPVSWAAVAAFATAVLFVVLLVFYGLQSWLKKQPLLYDMFLVLPILTLVLAFVGWMHVRNAEGTRTGRKLAVYAFWIGLLGVLGYGSYLLAISLAVRADTEKQFVEWVKDLSDIDPDNPADPGLYRAFHKTIQPGLRAGVSPESVTAMDRRFGNQIAGFRQNDLVAICYRNRGQLKFIPQGLVDWKMAPKTVQSPATLDANIAATVECPEGVYEVNVAMRATTNEAGQRDWQLVPVPNNLVKSARLTDYGRRLYELKDTARQAAERFLFFAQDPAKQDRGYLLFVKSPYTPAAEQAYLNQLPKLPAMFVIGAVVAVERSVIGYEADLFNRVFVPVMGPDAPKDPAELKKREEDMRKQFGFVWNAGRLRKAGTVAKDNPDKDPVLVVGPDRVTVRYPIELALPGGESATNTARGRIILECTDPAVLAELKKQRTVANPATATDASTPLTNWTPLHAPWKVVKIESDMAPMPSTAPRLEGMPAGGPPGG